MTNKGTEITAVFLDEADLLSPMIDAVDFRNALHDNAHNHYNRGTRNRRIALMASTRKTAYPRVFS